MVQSVVSIIVPCFNGEQFIDRCLQSIYEQKYNAIEVIVVDDGSTDGSKEKILAWRQHFQNDHRGLKYIFQQNKGLGAAINTGLKYVEGDYLSLLDADDEYLRGCVEEKVDFLESNREINVVRSNGYVVRGTNKYLFVQNDDECKRDIFRALLRGETNNWAGSYMVRTSALFKFYPDREIYQSKFGQNLQLLLPLVYMKECGYIDRPHMNYIQQEQSLSQTANDNEKKNKTLKNLDGYLDIRVHMLNKIVKNEAERKAFLLEIYEGYWCGIMRIAECFHDIDLMKSAYKKMSQYKNPNINDKILYYGVCHKPFCYLLRIMRRLYINQITLREKIETLRRKTLKETEK